MLKVLISYAKAQVLTRLRRDLSAGERKGQFGLSSPAAQACHLRGLVWSVVGPGRGRGRALWSGPSSAQER
ncbi:hypothetical protein AQJ23_16545 [Streptomyces antibioticus]|nr:hypothetical protein AQJ23_16545 [Streptomyces antibioticus]